DGAVDLQRLQRRELQDEFQRYWPRAALRISDRNSAAGVVFTVPCSISATRFLISRADASSTFESPSKSSRLSMSRFASVARASLGSSSACWSRASLSMNFNLSQTVQRATRNRR